MATRRNYTRELLTAADDGHLIVCSLAPNDGVPVQYMPRSKTDPSPWVLPSGDYRLTGRECHAVKIPTADDPADVAVGARFEPAAADPAPAHDGPAYGWRYDDERHVLLHLVNGDGWRTVHEPARPHSLWPEHREAKTYESAVSVCGTGLRVGTDDEPDRAHGQKWCRNCTDPVRRELNRTRVR